MAAGCLKQFANLLLFMHWRWLFELFIIIHCQIVKLRFVCWHQIDGAIVVGIVVVVVSVVHLGNFHRATERKTDELSVIVVVQVSF